MTVVDTMEVVTSLQEKKEIQSGKTAFKEKKKRKKKETHRPGSVDLVDVVDHLTGQWKEAGCGQAHRQAGSQ